MSAPKTPRLAAIVSRFNPEITGGLLAGARQALQEHGCDLAETDIYPAAGAFELPVIAKALASKGFYDGVIGLGCVIKGETAHFEFISLAASLGLMMTSLEAGIPVSFGILTTYDDAQADARSRPGPENKGREAALACLETCRTLSAIAAREA